MIQESCPVKKKNRGRLCHPSRLVILIDHPSASVCSFGAEVISYMSRWWSRLVVAVLIGSIVTISSNAIIEATESSGAISLIFILLMLPGTFVGMIFSGGNIHDTKRLVVDIANFVFYSGVAYLALSAYVNLRQGKSS